MRSLAIVATALFSTLLGTAALASDTAQPALASDTAQPMTTKTTTLGELLDNPDSRAVLEKHVPVLTQGGPVDQARPMTLKSLQPFMAETLTDDLLKQIDEDLAKLKK